jgi:hypothetical protein
MGIAVVAMLLVLALARVLPGFGAGPANPPDPLAAEIEHWSAFLRSDVASHGDWVGIKQGAQPQLTRAAQDLAHGRRLLALHRLVMARESLAIGVYLSQRPAEQRKDMARFEAEWGRMGKVLQADLKPATPDVLAGVQPAALRALGEAAHPQVREYYVASLDYGKSTTPDDGLYYIATAEADRQLLELCRRLSTPSALKPPPLRSLRPEIDALQSELYKAYRPPVSIDRHGTFITANATLKEARELDAAGLRYGALLRYLDAALIFAPLRQPVPTLAPAELRKRLDEYAARLSTGGVDHSIGRMMLEGAQDEMASAAPGTSPAASAAIAADVLPRYFAALGPAKPEASKPKPQVTVTLVRWPYT